MRVRSILTSLVSRNKFSKKSSFDLDLKDLPKCGSQSQKQCLEVDRDVWNSLKWIIFITRYLFNRKIKGNQPLILIFSVFTHFENIHILQNTSSTNFEKSYQELIIAGILLTDQNIQNPLHFWSPPLIISNSNFSSSKMSTSWVPLGPSGSIRRLTKAGTFSS